MSKEWQEMTNEYAKVMFTIYPGERRDDDDDLFGGKEYVLILIETVERETQPYLRYLLRGI